MNSDKDIQTSLESVVLYRIDSDKAENKDLGKLYKVKFLPTFVLVTKDGVPIDRMIGYEKDTFINTLADDKTDLATIDEKMARFKAGPDSKTAAALGRYSAGMLEYKDAVQYYRDAQNMKADSKADYTYNIFENTYKGATDDTVFTFVDASHAADAALLASKRNTSRIVDISLRMASFAQRIGNPAGAARYLQAGLDATTNSSDPQTKRDHASLMVNFAMYIKHDTATAVEYKKASMPDGWMDDAGQLNEFAWWCFENKTNLDEAEKLSQRSVDLAKPGKEKASNLDTLAEIKYAKGNTAAAIELTKKAIAEYPESKYFPTQLERFSGQSKAKE